MTAGSALHDSPGAGLDTRPLWTADYVPDWGSVDSAPEGLAVERSPWLTPGVLAAIGACSVMSVAWNTDIVGAYARLVAACAGNADLTAPQTIGLRPFLAAVVVVVTAALPGHVTDRVRVALGTFAWYALVVLALDVAMADGSPATPAPFSFTGNVVAAIAGVIVLTRSLFRWRELPAPVSVRQTRRHSVGSSIKMLLAIGLSAAMVYGVNTRGGGFVQALRDHAVVGGMGPGVMFALPSLWASLFVISRATGTSRPRPAARSPTQPLSVGFLVPAHNEAKVISACIGSIDLAARQYPGPCRIYIVDNLSSDATAEAAAGALAGCQSATGTVLSCTEPGKAHALNLGLDEISEDVVVRVDADTIVPASLVRQLVPHLADPAVAAVGGLTLPRQNRTLLDRVRAIEVFENAGFRRVAQAGVDAVLVVPGIMSAYRTDVVRSLGGFGVGFNGEDADIIIRIGRAGYRVVQDPAIVVRSEVPRSLGHLREQRLRWSRSVYHVAARNTPGVRLGQGPRGFVYLPMMLLYGSRKALIPPICVLGVVLVVTDSNVLDVRGGAALAAMLAGLGMMMTIFSLVVYRQFRLLLYVPAYLCFRAFRAYIALEALLTLPPRQRRGDTRRALTTSKPLPQAALQSPVDSTAVAVPHVTAEGTQAGLMLRSRRRRWALASAAVATAIVFGVVTSSVARRPVS